MASAYIVSHPVYGGPAPQGSSMAFSPVEAPRSNMPYPSMGPYCYSATPPSLQHAASSDHHYDDLPNFRGTTGLIILCLYLLLPSSLFACLGRADFNFVLYLLGYHIWCVESDMKTTAGMRRLVRSARQFAVLLSVATLVDITWHFIAFSTWACDKGEAQLCFPEPQNLQVRWTYEIHSLALSLSLINLVLKVLVIFLSFSWVQQQRKAEAPQTQHLSVALRPQKAPRDYHE
ncbi:hypothetical protein cyc_02012 [Cyclospora cayetanensis]|uniref:Transmembrane protein n=1 Tax=Cyclospora cayetanensis TaxID=88456 RepID=A0A1D3CW82_9EIME|nr:hypothetical protein cyc_02012 [Cyclospora cayetanensis]